MNGKKITSLFNDATERGLISQAAAESLNAPDIGRVIQAGIGLPADQFESGEVYLQILMLDDSGSIEMGGNIPHLCEGANLVKRELLASANADEIMLCVMTINGVVLYPFGPLEGAPDLDPASYHADKGTPLYDAMISGSGLLLAKWREFAQIGATARGAALWVTDGRDEHSKQKPGAVKPVINDLTKRELFLAMFMGIDDGVTNFRDVALSCGIGKDFILTPGNSGSEIRRAFRVASRASKIASQGAKGFSQIATGGGFGTITE